MGFVVAPANRNDSVLLPDTLDAIDDQGLLEEVEALHLDRGYDNSVVRRQVADAAGIAELVVSSVRRGRTRPLRTKRQLPLGRRWVVERTNSWLTNYGQLRCNTDRKAIHRQAAMALVIAILLITKLIDAGHLGRL